jgi:hypothetical protein
VGVDGDIPLNVNSNISNENHDCKIGMLCSRGGEILVQGEGEGEGKRLR